MPDSPPIDANLHPDLARLIRAWSRLPAETRRAIVAHLDTTHNTETTR